MLESEAKWFKKAIDEIDITYLSPIINIGSNSAYFRKKIHPWIEFELFGPLLKDGAKIHHTDIINQDGVDLVGDLQDEVFLNSLKNMKFNSVFCTHLFEHVVNREEISKVIEDIITSGGYLFISCPYQFPYHPGPIDTMYRPNIDELKSLFPNTQLVRSSLVSEYVLFYLLTRILKNPFEVIKKISAKSFDKKNNVQMASVGTLIKWLHKKFVSTCVVLRKL